MTPLETHAHKFPLDQQFYPVQFTLQRKSLEIIILCISKAIPGHANQERHYTNSFVSLQANSSNQSCCTWWSKSDLTSTPLSCTPYDQYQLTAHRTGTTSSIVCIECAKPTLPKMVRKSARISWTASIKRFNSKTIRNGKHHWIMSVKELIRETEP